MFSFEVPRLVRVRVRKVTSTGASSRHPRLGVGCGATNFQLQCCLPQTGLLQFVQKQCQMRFASIEEQMGDLYK